MRPALVPRVLALAAAALLAGIVALAIASRDAKTTELRDKLPRPAVSDLSGWYPARAGVRKRPLAGRRSGCGTILNPKTLGVDHPVLPCGTRLFVRFRAKTVLTQVVDRGPFGPGIAFEVTPGLADILGLEGVQPIRWSFARAP